MTPIFINNRSISQTQIIEYGDQLSEIELIEKNKEKKLKAGSIMSEMEGYEK